MRIEDWWWLLFKKKTHTKQADEPFTTNLHILSRKSFGYKYFFRSYKWEFWDIKLEWTSNVNFCMSMSFLLWLRSIFWWMWIIICSYYFQNDTWILKDFNIRPRVLREMTIGWLLQRSVQRSGVLSDILFRILNRMVV